MLRITNETVSCTKHMPRTYVICSWGWVTLLSKTPIISITVVLSDERQELRY